MANVSQRLVAFQPRIKLRTSNRNITSSDQSDEEAYFKMTYSLSRLMVINDEVRLGDWLKGQLLLF